MDRNLREPGRALVQKIDDMSRKLETLRSRTLQGVARSTIYPGIFISSGISTPVETIVPSGLWVVLVQATYTVSGSAAGTRLVLGITVTPTSTGVASPVAPMWPLASTTIAWDGILDGFGDEIPAEVTLNAQGLIIPTQEVRVSLNPTHAQGGTSGSWSNGRITLLPY